jgi:hypothetical protein
MKTKFAMEKLRKAEKEHPQAKNLLKWERKQALENELKGYWKGREVSDTERTVWFWTGFIAGGVMGFYLASLLLFASFCNG